MLARDVAAAQRRLDLAVGEAGTEIRGSERLRRGGHAARRAEVDVREIRRADGIRFVAAGRKHEELARPLFGRQQHVGFHVHEHTAAERQTLAAVPLAHQAGPAQQRLLDDRLRAARDRIEAQPEGRLDELAIARPAPRPREEAGLAFGEGEDAAERGRRVGGGARARIGREPHDLVLVLAELHPQQQRDERIERAERSRRAR